MEPAKEIAAQGGPVLHVSLRHSLLPTPGSGMPAFGNTGLRMEVFSGLPTLSPSAPMQATSAQALSMGSLGVTGVGEPEAESTLNATLGSTVTSTEQVVEMPPWVPEKVTEFPNWCAAAEEAVPAAAAAHIAAVIAAVVVAMAAAGGTIFA